MGVEGEAGIGKSQSWYSMPPIAPRIRGFRVLSAHGSPAEVSYAYSAVADLVSGVEDATVAALPELQRIALQRAQLGVVVAGAPATDQRMVANAFLSVIERMSAQAPLLLAIDDGQWLDASSRAVIGYTARRLTGRTGLLVTFRTGESVSANAQSWLDFCRPETITRLRMRPLTLGGLHVLIAARLGHTPPRPAIVRIYEISGGNSFFALELADSTGTDVSATKLGLPESLAALVRRRIGEVDDDVAVVLLAAACAAAPTVELVASATEMTLARVVESLESAENLGVVALDGNQVRFTHPLFATGVYADAAPFSAASHAPQLRHRCRSPEVKARHLALATTEADAATLSTLDAAAEATVAQGAPS